MARIVLNPARSAGTISRNIYGHFSEHLGRCIYQGLYVGEDSTIPNVRGMRTDVVEALKKAQAWPIIEGLDNGLDTNLGDEGVRLSGGERQRIVLARVLLGKPRLIVMDEATSAMDYESETAVRAAIRELHGEVTILIIAHRLATVRTAKYALVLENGQITEDGLLAELVRTPDGYLNKLLYIE